MSRIERYSRPRREWTAEERREDRADAIRYLRGLFDRAEDPARIFAVRTGRGKAFRPVLAISSGPCRGDIVNIGPPAVRAGCCRGAGYDSAGIPATVYLTGGGYSFGDHLAESLSRACYGEPDRVRFGGWI